ncbi:elongation factor 1 [Blastocystis sp. subtype 4]|uniref:elongation factor 1 n=1 Tax=Blastocystis sp. subtype 4 TaxID=944170 RepID=UPI000711A501|nr:elongation factor 1 [Blastocystis sp. subtype 4]KNB41179.1 elongation factor 1 [Blastocystis sp. subtype 4]|eukprot:XP_014524622.1 elongation factor 1 [Blastocystis sp. subtype 4]
MLIVSRFPEFCFSFVVVYNDFKTLEELNEYFLNHSYCVGYAPSSIDAAMFAMVHKYMDAAKYPHLARWFTHMCSFPNKAYSSFNRNHS